jgi:hypothetical protein
MNTLNSSQLSSLQGGWGDNDDDDDVLIGASIIGASCILAYTYLSLYPSIWSEPLNVSLQEDYYHQGLAAGQEPRVIHVYEKNSAYHAGVFLGEYKARRVSGVSE